jgi:diguanylate cyclase (GGDEF)-like protein
MMRAERSGKKRSMSTATKTLILLLIMVVAFGLYATQVITNSIDQFQAEQTAQNLQLAKITAGAIDDYISGGKQILVPLANQKDVRSQNFPAASKWMKWFVSTNPNYSLAVFVDTKGYVRALGVSNKLGANEGSWKIGVSNAVAFAKTLTANDLKVGGYKHSQIAKTSVVNIGYPVFDFASKRIGVIVVTLDLANLQNEIIKNYYGESNHVLLTVVDEKGYTVARSSDLQKFIGDISPNTSYMLKQIKRNKSGSVKADFAEGVSGAISYASTTEVPWFVHVGSYSDYMQAKLKDEVNSMVIGFAVLTLFLGLGLWWVSRGREDEQALFERIHSVDVATGLWNADRLLNDIKREHDRAKRYRQEVSFVLVDIDDYDHYVGKNGQKAADDAMRAIAQIVSGTIRETDTVYRYSNGEICVLLPCTDKTGVEYMAKRVINGVQEHQFAGAQNQPNGELTISIGAATYPHDSIASDGIVGCAEHALGKAKQTNTNSFVSYSEESPNLYAAN